MASIEEVFQATGEPEINRKDNQQLYEQFPTAYVHVKPAQHILGLVGGNEVAGIRGNRVDLESDLLGITRPNSWATELHHLPPTSDTIERQNRKIGIQIDATPTPLKEFQLWAYPATVAPQPVKQQVCMRPEKY